MYDYRKNLPNALTISRIVIIPLFILSFYIDQNYKILAAILFVIASVTDFFDGYLSRKWGTVSKMGTLLDPTADKMIVVTALVMLIHFDVAHIVPAILIICREIFISGLREYLAARHVNVPVTKLAKWKTGVQMTALIVLLIDAGGVNKFFYIFGNASLWVAAALTVYTGYQYFMAAYRSNIFAEHDIEISSYSNVSVDIKKAPPTKDTSDLNDGHVPTDEEVDASFAKALRDAEKAD